ncbi:MAG: serine O-acetyltransferase [Desulfuromonadales bacterium]|nr:serine O-acetyltransferase [Chloroflexota bacterium]MCK4622403.1 serine O-acetyltransferase [Desulfuromonadales bacterium]
MFSQLKQDLRAVFDRDPAVRSVFEIIFCYPGFHAMLFYRPSHWLWTHRFHFLGRFVSHVGRFMTGIEIHPGAVIGPSFFIDHGMGVVIGETAEIGENCTLYHGVTLGGTSWAKEKRHPTLEDNVIVGSGAKILGPFTVGRDSKIGSNSVVVKEVPKSATVVGIPGRVVLSGEQQSGADLEHGNLPDPVAKAVSCMMEQIGRLEDQVQSLKQEQQALKAELERTRETETS